MRVRLQRGDRRGRHGNRPGPLDVSTQLRAPLRLSRTDAYLWTATRNAAIDQLRKASRRHEFLVDSNDWHTLEPLLEHAPSAEDVVTAGVVNEEPVAKVQSLPHMQRRVIELSFLKDLPIHETAELLGISTDTARRDRLRALKALRAMYMHARPDTESRSGRGR